MGERVTLTGRVTTGTGGESRRFTSLPWVRARFRERVGIDPYPGTLNLWLDGDGQVDRWAATLRGRGIPIEPEQEGFCEARAFPAGVAREATGGGAEVRAAVVVPLVPDYPSQQVELVAPVNLRHSLGLEEGDTVAVTVEV